jgi:hypothetical protein
MMEFGVTFAIVTGDGSGHSPNRTLPERSSFTSCELNALGYFQWLEISYDLE